MSGVIFPWEKPFSFYPGKNYIAQEYIPLRRKEYSYWEKDGNLEVDKFYERFTIWLSKGGLADWVVTARTSPKVHGATDCLQI